METWKHYRSCCTLLAALAALPMAAPAAEPVCPAGQVPAERAVTSRPAPAPGDAAIPRVTVPRERCVPAPVQRKCGADCGCGTAQATQRNAPPSRQAEPAFGEVPVAALVPPSMPYPDQVPAGPARAGAPQRPGCDAKPAS